MHGAVHGRSLAAAALLVLLWHALIGVAQAAAEKRVALVIGNSAYQNVTRLDNPRNDAALMAETLASLGFTLIGGRAQARPRQAGDGYRGRKASAARSRAPTSRCSITPATASRCPAPTTSVPVSANATTRGRRRFPDARRQPRARGRCRAPARGSTW